MSDASNRLFRSVLGTCLVINPQAQTGSILEHPIGEKNGNPLSSGALLLSMSGGNKTIPPKMQRELKKPGDTSIKILTGGIESETPPARPDQRRQSRHDEGATISIEHFDQFISPDSVPFHQWD
jgi:hypothetical protein